MLKNLLTTSAVLALGFASTAANADHRYRHHHVDRGDKVGYLLGGAIIGAAIGEIIHSSRHDGYRRGYRESYRYYPPRYRVGIRYYSAPRYRARHYYRPYRHYYAPRREHRRYRYLGD